MRKVQVVVTNRLEATLGVNGKDAHGNVNGDHWALNCGGRFSAKALRPSL